MFRKFSALATTIVLLYFGVRTVKAMREATESARREYQLAREAISIVEVMDDVIRGQSSLQDSVERTPVNGENQATVTMPVATIPAPEIAAAATGSGRSLADEIALEECVDSRLSAWLSQGLCEASWIKPNQVGTDNTLVIAVDRVLMAGSLVEVAAGQRPANGSDKLYMRFPGIARVARGGTTPVLTCNSDGHPMVVTVP